MTKASASNLRKDLATVGTRSDLTAAERAEIRTWAARRGYDLQKAEAKAKRLTAKQVELALWKQRECHRLKADEYERVFPGSVKIGQHTAHSFRKIEGGFECTIDGPGTDNPYRFHNPPLCVDDDNGDVEVVADHPQLGRHIRRMREDASAALLEVLTDAIRRLG